MALPAETGTRASSVLIIRHGALGDIILSQGIIRDIREAHPDAVITALTIPAYTGIFQRCPNIDKVVTEQRAPANNITATMAALRLVNGHYDIIYDLMRSDRTFIYRCLYHGGASWHHEPGGSKIPRFNMRHIFKSKEEPKPKKRRTHPPLDWLGDDCTELCSRYKVTGDYIVLVPGSSARHPHKRWPYYQQLADELAAAGHTVLSAPGPDEIDSMPAGITRILNLDGSCIDLFALTGLLQKARLVIGNDTGPTHIAAASGVNTIMIMWQKPGTEFAALHGNNMRHLYPENNQPLPLQQVLPAVMADLQK